VSTCHDIRTPRGRVLQLIRVNARVSSALPSGGGGLAAGALLRDFALAFASKLGLALVCAVTRCTDFHTRGTKEDFVDYALSRPALGITSDSGLSFHLRRGAVVRRCVPGWRDGDTANLGFGVLVTYDLTDLVMSNAPDITCSSRTL